MKSLNLAICIGNVGRKSEPRFTPKGTKVVDVSLATNETYKDAGGQQQKVTDWKRLQFFGNLAEVAEKYITVGSPIWILGSPRTRTYEDSQGVKRSITQIRVSELGLLGKNGNGNGAGAATAGSQAGQPIGEDEVPF
ncbi:MAG: single-stranded DNA-binding protein [Nitrososphaera sp.]|nr:single-stranded DNA-binding protein [Nitrososphaera sp.]